MFGRNKPVPMDSLCWQSIPRIGERQHRILFCCLLHNHRPSDSRVYILLFWSNISQFHTLEMFGICGTRGFCKRVFHLYTASFQGSPHICLWIDCIRRRGIVRRFRTQERSHLLCKCVPFRTQNWICIYCK